jgi:hypothetical protein
MSANLASNVQSFDSNNNASPIRFFVRAWRQSERWVFHTLTNVESVALVHILLSILIRLRPHFATSMIF